MVDQWELIIVQAAVAMIVSNTCYAAGFYQQGHFCVKELSLNTRLIVENLVHTKVEMTPSLQWLLATEQISIIHKAVRDGDPTMEALENLKHQLYHQKEGVNVSK